MVRGSVLSRVELAHHRFDVAYSLLTEPTLGLDATFSLTVTAAADGNQELVLSLQSDIANRETFYTHNGLQFMRRRKSSVRRALAASAHCTG